MLPFQYNFGELNMTIDCGVDFLKNGNVAYFKTLQYTSVVLIHIFYFFYVRVLLISHELGMLNIMQKLKLLGEHLTTNSLRTKRTEFISFSNMDFYSRTESLYINSIFGFLPQTLSINLSSNHC